MASVTSPALLPFDRSTRSYRLRWWVLGVLCLSLLVIVVDNSILNVALPHLQEDLNATFSQLDVRVERRFTFDRWVLGIYLDCINVLNSENAEGVLYDYRSRQSAPLRGVPILPILGLRGRF